MKSLILFIVICFTIAGLSGMTTTSAVRDWYPLLNKPAWTPPDSLFGPVWSLLYLMIALAGWLLWKSEKDIPALMRAKTFYVLQLLLNFIWTPVFFGAHQIGWAFAEIVFLWLSIILTIVFAWRISRSAAYLLMPYLGWVTFASALNFAIWRLN